MNTSILADDEPKLMPWSIREYALADALGIKLVSGIVGVDKLNDLLVRHADTPVASQLCLLLESPAVDILRVFGVYVDECVELVCEGIVCT